MADQKTTGEPREAAEITDDKVNAAVDAVADTGPNWRQMEVVIHPDAPQEPRRGHSL